jgi:hypothetical protein
LKKKKKRLSQALVVHTCNPSYSGSRDQEDHGLKPTLSKYFPKTLSQKKPSQKGVGEELKV